MRFFFTGPRVFGLRPGVSFGPEDFRRLSRPGRGETGHMTGGFVYVVKDQSGRHKIGSSRNPIARIAQLQTGSAEALDFAFIGVAQEEAYTRIERAAHDLLENQKIPGVGDEWFQVPASIAIGAVIEAANRLGAPIQQVSPIMVPQIINLANRPDPNVNGLSGERRWGILASLPWYQRYPAAIMLYGTIVVITLIVVAIIVR